MNLQIETKKIFEICERYDQKHLIDHFSKLSEKERSVFVKNIKNVDFPLLRSLYVDFKSGKKSALDPSKIEPPDVISYPVTEEEKKRQEKAKAIGESLLRERKVTCLLVAGGQATRLGTSSPKGFFPITPVAKKTFFQLFSEKILALSKRYDTEMPFLIMTNPESKDEIGNFFKRHKFFGLKKESVIIFEQDTLPVLTREGKVIIANDTEILLSPNGHGNSIKRIYDLGILDMLIERGYQYLFYFQVDNPLVKIADPVFLGYHVLSGADVSLKVVRKKSEDEKVGLYVKISGKPAIVEYSELDPNLTSSRDENGNFIFWAGNTAIHVFSLDFLKRINVEKAYFPYHIAEKKTYVEKEGKEIEVLKFETFVFDCLRWAKKACAMEILREEEFSPVKNRVGPSSPATAQEDISNLFKKWLAACGVEVPKDVYLEISPLFAIDMEECVEKLKGKNLIVTRDTYIE